MKNSKLTALIAGLISIAATVIFYLLTFDNIFTIPMRWVSLLFLLSTECIGTLKTQFVKQNIITQTTLFTSIAHLVTVLVLSIIFVNFFPIAIKTYILLNILVLCVLAVIDLFILYFAKSASSSDKKLAQSQGVMDACYAKAQDLVVVYGDGDYKKDLLEIAGDGDTVIELGCHLGGTTKLLENCKVFAVDNSPEAVDVMNSLDNVTFISGDVRRCR